MSLDIFFRIFSCCFPTSWEPDTEADELFDVLALLVDNCHRCGAGALVGGDLNASSRTCLKCDEVEMIGQCGFGELFVGGC